MGSTRQEHSSSARERDKRSQVGLFAGKLRRPEPSPEAVQRPRLFRLLEEGVDRGLTIVSAPAGSGKTRLVADWLAGNRRTPRDLAWLTLDPADRDPARFLGYVVSAIAGTTAGRDAFSDVAGLPPLSSPDESYLVAVQEGMGRLTGDVVLVIDDFHEVAGTESEQLLARIVRYPAAHVRLVVLSRTEPDLGQARLRLAGRLCEVGQADLDFRLDETRQVLRSNDVSLTDQELRLVQERTGGWVAAVQLTGSALRRSPDPAAAVNRLPVGNLQLEDYVMAELFDGQTGDSQSFMLSTCVVDEVCGDLADALTGTTGGERVLAGLRRANLMTADADRPGGWYRWHPTLAAVLRGRLNAQSGSRARRLHRLAAHWFRHEGLLVTAIPHALAGREVAAAAAMLGDCWLDLVVSGESAVLTDLLRLFDDEALTSHPDLAVAAAFMGARSDDVDASLRLARQATDVATSHRAPHRREIDVMVAVVRLYAATMTGETCEGADRSAAALLEGMSRATRPLSRMDRTRRAFLLYNLGAYETSRQQYETAVGHLRAAMSEARTLDLPYLQLSCHAQLVERDLQIGELNRGRMHGLKVLDAAANRGWRSYHGLTAAHVNLAAIAVLHDDLDAALRHLAEAGRIARPVDRVNRIRIASLKVSALCSAGKVADAATELGRLRQESSRADLPAWVPVTVATVEAMYQASLGRPADGLERLASVSVERVSAQALRAHHTVRAGLLLRCGRAPEARKALAPWRGDPRWPVSVAALVVDALAAEEMSRHGEALDGLEQALRAAAPEGLLRPFVTPGPLVRPLLEELLDRGTAHEPLVLRILEHMSPSASVGSTSGRSPHYVDRLTEREQEVLQLMQGTLTNAEIAERLFVTANTLHSHMKSLNRKLGASGRRDAVRRARDLGIL